jgi:hypothetical protein
LGEGRIWNVGGTGEEDAFELSFLNLELSVPFMDDGLEMVF